MRVLVTGGTGVVGRPAVTRLVQRGHTVRLLSRRAEQAAADWEQGVEPYPADVADAASLEGAAEGCDAVLHIVGIVDEDPPEATFQRVNVEGTENLLAEARRAGVGRFVYVSSLGAERGASDYHRSKREAEERVRAFAGSWLIVRPGNVYGPGDQVISLLLKLVRVAPVIPLIGRGDQCFQPIWGEDLAAALVSAVEDAGLTGRALDVAGPEAVSVAELLDRLERLTDTHPRRVPVPAWLAQTGAGLAESLGVHLPVNAGQMVMLEEENVIAQGAENALTTVFGIDPTPLDRGLALLVDATPESLPRDGRGDLHRHRYWADLRGSRLGAEELLEVVARDFAALPAPAVLRVGAEPGSPTRLEEGATLTLEIPLRGHVQVRVEEVEPRAITAVTLQGHPLTGTVRFLAEEPEPGVVRFEVRTYTRPASLLDQLAMATIGEAMKATAWRSVVQGVVERSGGERVGEIEQETVVLDEQALDDVERWVEELIRRRRRRE